MTAARPEVMAAAARSPCVTFILIGLSARRACR
jgi:hypothetical protein